jgi:hypothetical protein
MFSWAYRKSVVSGLCLMGTFLFQARCRNEVFLEWKFATTDDHVLSVKEALEKVILRVETRVSRSRKCQLSRQEV